MLHRDSDLGTMEEEVPESSENGYSRSKNRDSRVGELRVAQHWSGNAATAKEAA
jgi:hypothetical protein